MTGGVGDRGAVSAPERHYLLEVAGLSDDALRQLQSEVETVIGFAFAKAAEVLGHPPSADNRAMIGRKIADYFNQHRIPKLRNALMP